MLLRSDDTIYVSVKAMNAAGSVSCVCICCIAPIMEKVEHKNVREEYIMYDGLPITQCNALLPTVYSIASSTMSPF